MSILLSKSVSPTKLLGSFTNRLTNIKFAQLSEGTCTTFPWRARSRENFDCRSVKTLFAVADLTKLGVTECLAAHIERPLLPITAGMNNII